MSGMQKSQMKIINTCICLVHERFLDPVRRGMNFCLISQDSSGGRIQLLTSEPEADGGLRAGFFDFGKGKVKFECLDTENYNF